MKRTYSVAAALLAIGLAFSSVASAASIARASISRPVSTSRPAVVTVYRPAPSTPKAPLTSNATAGNRPAVTAPPKAAQQAETSVPAAPAPAAVHTREIRTETSSSSSWLIPWLLFSNSSHSTPAPAPTAPQAATPPVPAAAAVPASAPRQDDEPCQKPADVSWFDRLMGNAPAAKPCEKEETHGNRF